MKIRVKFAKRGNMRFIGHLDIMRYFQKAIRRADIDISMSEGYSPHQIMSFAAPLGVGLTSEGEYMDIEVNSTLDSNSMVAMLNKVMTDGMEVLSFKEIRDDKKAMATVAAADYFVRLRNNEIYDNLNFAEIVSQFNQKESAIVTKKTKKSETEVDIKPMIHNLSYEENYIINKESYNGFFMKLATGSVNNLKPELVMDTLLKDTINNRNLTIPEFPYLITRLEVYGNAAAENEKIKLISLEDMCYDI